MGWGKNTVWDSVLRSSYGLIDFGNECILLIKAKRAQVWFWIAASNYARIFTRVYACEGMKGQNVSARGIILGHYILRQLKAQEIMGPYLGLRHHIGPAS